jgi:hypothetical protein
VPTEVWIRLKDLPDHLRDLPGSLPGTLFAALAVAYVSLLSGVQPSIERRFGDSEVLLHPASGNLVVGHMPQDLEPLHRGVAPLVRGRIEPGLEEPVLPFESTVLIPQASHLSRLPANSGRLLQQQQTLLTARFCTQHHASDHQGNGCPKDLHASTLL